MTTSSQSIQVVLADDHVLVRAGIARLLGRLAGVEVIAEASSGEELLDVLAAVRPDVVLTDIDMPGMDGIAATRAIRQRHPAVKVVMLTMFDEVEYIRRAVAEGAAGYVLKEASAQELELALHGVVETGHYFSPSIAQRLLVAGSSIEEQLTERQRAVLKLLAEGNSTKEIAYQLGISIKTVDVHRAQIMKRLGIEGVAGLTRYALRKGLVRA